MKIFKYPLVIGEINKLMIPAPGKVISFQIQNDVPVFWAIVDSEAKGVERLFEIIPTGQEFEIRNKGYHGTVQLNGCVWHLFEYVGGEQFFNATY